MKISACLVAIALAAAGLVGLSGAASAQASRTWVSGVGDDANPCSRTAPCKTFAGAISKTAAGGEINCIDPAGFGAVTITKAMTISCAPVEGGVLNSSSNGIIVNITTALTPTDIVVLRGLDIDSAPAVPGLNGIRVMSATSVQIEQCYIRDNGGASPNGNGILINPSVGSPEVLVVDTIVSGNGINVQGAGISVAPTGSGGAKVTIAGSTINNNNNGIRATNAGTTGNIAVAISGSTISMNTGNGVAAIGTNAGFVRVMVEGSNISNNGEANSGAGIRANGANAVIRIKDNLITGNDIGLQAASGGQIQSYSNNAIEGNTSDGAPTGVLPQK